MQSLEIVGALDVCVWTLTILPHERRSIAAVRMCCLGARCVEIPNLILRFWPGLDMEAAQSAMIRMFSRDYLRQREPHSDFAAHSCAMDADGSSHNKLLRMSMANAGRGDP